MSALTRYVWCGAVRGSFSFQQVQQDVRIGGGAERGFPVDQAIADEGHSGPHVERMRAAFRRVALILVNDLREWGLPDDKTAT